MAQSILAGHTVQDFLQVLLYGDVAPSSVPAFSAHSVLGVPLHLATAAFGAGKLFFLCPGEAALVGSAKRADTRSIANFFCQSVHGGAAVGSHE